MKHGDYIEDRNKMMDQENEFDELKEQRRKHRSTSATLRDLKLVRNAILAMGER
jgi:hypothetical protein